MSTTVTIEVEHKYGVYDCSTTPYIEFEADGGNALIVTLGASTAKLTKKKVLETAQALNYLATTMEDEE